MNVLDDIEINIKMRDFNKNPLAIVTLAIDERIEIRFAPICWKNKRTEIFFSMPAMGHFGFRHCVVFLDVDEFHQLTIQVLNKLKEEARKVYTEEQAEIISRFVDERIILIKETPNSVQTRQ